MGSFNVACGFSGMTIQEGDATSLSLLNHTEFTRDDVTKGNFVIVNSNAFYTPVSAPIHGYYGDYGRIEDADEFTSSTKSILQTEFAMDLKDIVTCASNDNRGFYDSYGPIF